MSLIGVRTYGLSPSVDAKILSLFSSPLERRDKGVPAGWMLGCELHRLQPVGMMGEGFPEVILEQMLTDVSRGPISTGVYACHTGAGSGRTA